MYFTFLRFFVFVFSTFYFGMVVESKSKYCCETEENTFLFFTVINDENIQILNSMKKNRFCALIEIDFYFSIDFQTAFTITNSKIELKI